MTTVYTNFCGQVVNINQSGTSRDIIPDPLGSTAHLVDDTQTKKASYTYTPYGEIESHSGETTPLNFVGTLGYYRDAVNSTLTYIRARWYKAMYGRWMTVDPLWPRYPKYVFVENSPQVYRDVSGTVPLKITITDDILFQYGNYCGSRNADPSKKRNPIGCIDWCCFKHDIYCEDYPFASLTGAEGHCALWSCAIGCLLGGGCFRDPGYTIAECLSAADAIVVAFMFVCASTTVTGVLDSLISPFLEAPPKPGGPPTIWPGGPPGSVGGWTIGGGPVYV